jgi:hypothetical protein
MKFDDLMIFLWGIAIGVNFMAWWKDWGYAKDKKRLRESENEINDKHGGVSEKS